MSSNGTRTTRGATRWVRVLSLVVTVGLLATVGVHLGAYGRRAVGESSVWIESGPFAVDPEPLSIVATVLHDASVLGGLLALAGAGWLGLVLVVRVAFGLREFG